MSTEGRVLYEIGYYGDTGTPRATATTAADLAKVLALDGGYLSRILQRFARRKLITRTPSAADARQADLAPDRSRTGRARAAAAAGTRRSRCHAAAPLSG